MKWNVKNQAKSLSAKRARRSQTPKIKGENAKLTQKPVVQPTSEASWMDQLRHHFQQETPNDWIPAPYQGLFQHFGGRKIGA